MPFLVYPTNRKGTVQTFTPNMWIRRGRPSHLYLLVVAQDRIQVKYLLLLNTRQFHRSASLKLWIIRINLYTYWMQRTNQHASQCGSSCKTWFTTCLTVRSSQLVFGTSEHLSPINSERKEITIQNATGLFHRKMERARIPL